MENSVGGGGELQQRRLALPPGMRFLPTDEELLTFYLRSKVVRRSPPDGFHIPICELYSPGGEPWVLQRKVDFPYGQGSEFYCFTHRTRRGPGALRTTGLGTWSAKGKDVEVRVKHEGKLLGHKLMLKFVPKGDGGGGDDDDERSNWIMHEYRLPDSHDGGSKGGAKRFQELVLCKIYQRRGAPASSEESAEICSITNPR